MTDGKREAMKAYIRRALSAAIALGAAAPQLGRAETSAPGQRSFEVFSCRFESGGEAKLVLTRAGPQRWQVSLVQSHPKQARLLSSVRVKYIGFAHGGGAVVEARSDGSTLHLFEQEGGVEESFGALTETTREGTATRFCIPDSVKTKGWLDRTPPSQLVSLTALQRLGIAVDLPNPPDFPQEPQGAAKTRAR